MKTKSLKRYGVALGMIALLLGVSDLTLGKGSMPAAPGDTEARFKLNEGSGTTAGDHSGNANDGTLQGDTAWATGRQGQALTFDGDGDYVSCGTTGLVAANASQSISWWMKYASVPSDVECAVDIHDSMSSSAIQTGFRSSKVTVWKHGGGVLVDATPPSTGEWHHYAYTFDGTTHRLYIDGNQVSTSTAAPQTATPDTLVLGRCDNCAGEYFTGELDEVLVYSRELSAAEVVGLAHDPALEILYHLEENAGTNAGDESGKDWDGTIQGATWTTSGKEGNALDFDGTDDYVDLGTNLRVAQDIPAATVAMFVKIENLPGSGAFQELFSLAVNNSGTATNTSRIALALKGDGTGADVFSGGRTTDTGGQQNTTDDSTLAAATWYHVAAVLDFAGDTIKIYVDGTESISTSVSFTNAATPDTVSENGALGAQDKGDANFFDGIMDEIRFYSRALSADEIAGLAGGDGTGLAAVYYDNMDWTGTFITRTDETVNFDWGSGSPDAAIGADTFSAVWTGQVQPRYTETYTFTTETDDGVRLWVDGDLIVDFPQDQGATEHSGSIALSGGKKVDIRMEYYENGGLAVAKLKWESASTPKAIIPKEQLFPTTGKPLFVSATAESGALSTVYLRFNEAMDKTSAETAGNYTVSGPITVNSATLSSDKRVVTLALASNVTLNTTTATASTSVKGITQVAIDQTQKTIVAGGSSGVPDADAITLSLLTDNNKCVIQQGTGASFGVSSGQGELLTVTAPGSTATEVEIVQVKKIGGKSVVSFEQTQSSITVTTSGGATNQAFVRLDAVTTGAFEKDFEIVARVSDEERGFKPATVIDLTLTPKCLYLADQRGARQTAQVTPTIEGLTFSSMTFVVDFGKTGTASPTTLLARPDFPATDSTGKAVRFAAPCGEEVYIYDCVGPKGRETAPAGAPYDGPNGKYGDTQENSNSNPSGDTEAAQPKGTQNAQSPCPVADSEDLKPVKSVDPRTSRSSIDPSDGEKKLDIIDLAIPGRGFHYVFRRLYRSHNYRAVLSSNPDVHVVEDFGENWVYSYADEYLVMDGDDQDTANIVNFRDGNSGNVFSNRGDKVWSPAKDNYTLLRINADGDFEIREEDGDIRVYHDFSDPNTPNKNGRLKEIRDRNENRMTFHYEEIDPDNTVADDEKMVLAYVIDTLGREIRYQYFAKTAQTVNGRPLTTTTATTAAYGRLFHVKDFKSNMEFDGTEELDFPGQDANRQVQFDYDSEGNLVKARSPIVKAGSTPTGNDFNSGRTFRYKYIVESDLSTLVTNWGSLTNDQKDVVRGRLLHKLTHIWYPNEVRNSGGTNPALTEAAEVLTYDTTVDFEPDTSTFLKDGTFLGFVTRYQIGDVDENGTPITPRHGNDVPSGGTIVYEYTDLNPDRDMPAFPHNIFIIKSLQVDVTDRNGNEAEYVYSGERTLMEYREKTSGLRTGEPANFEKLYDTNGNAVLRGDRLLTKRTYPEDNTIEYTYNTGSSDRFQQSNLIRVIRKRGSRAADQDEIEMVYVYEPIYNRPCLVVQARGANSDNNGFTPPIADVLDRTMTDPYDASRKLDLRYARVEFFDYQESTEKATNAPDTRLDIDGTGGKVNESPLISVDGDVLTTEVWLVQELGLSETSTGLTELRNRLSDNLTNLGLGDLNGDNDTTPAVAGNIIRTVLASPVILANTNQDKLESDIETAGDLIDETKTYGQGGTNEGTFGGRLQTIVWMHRFNPFGQLIQTSTPEGNVSTFEYFPENDADGDLNTTPAPADGRTLDTTTGGYLKQSLKDRTRTDADVKVFDQSGTNKDTATFYNNNTAPTATDIAQSYTYDDVGNLTSVTTPRGIRDNYFVNELNAVVRVTLSEDVSGASSADPADPLVGAGIGPLTAFKYEARLFFDFNGNVALSQVEDRGNTSNVDGSGLGAIPSQATDTTPGLSAADSTGGKAYVDTLTLFDRLNNRIETRGEIDKDASLKSRFRYDGNQHRVLVIHAEGNGDSVRFDDRELIFQESKGITTRPSEGLYASGDPTAFDRPGGSSTEVSTFTFNYDENMNLVEFVDAADTDSSSVNGSGIAGAGDVTAYSYDGFDRRKTVRDTDGNVTTYVYDPDSNIIRVIQDGDPVDDVVPGSFPDGDNKTLAVEEAVYDSLSRMIVSHQVLFKTPVATPARVITLEDSVHGLGTTGMDALAAYLSDANSDTAAVPGAIGIGVIGRVTLIQEYDRESRSTFTIQDDLDLYRSDYDGAGRAIRTMDSHVSTGFSGGVFAPANQKGNAILQAYDDSSNVIEVREFDLIDIDSNGIADSFDANHDGTVSSSDTVLDYDLDGTADADAEVFRTTMLYDSLDRVQTSVDNLGHTIDKRYDSRSQGVARADAQGPVNTRTVARRWKNPFDSVDTETTSVTVNDFGNVTRTRFDGIGRVLEGEAILTASGQGDGTNIGATIEGVQAKAGGDVDYSDVPARDTTQSTDGLLSVYYAYDENSQLLAFRDDNGNTIGYIYDNQNRTLVERMGLAETGTTFTIVGGDTGAFSVSLRGGTAPVDSEPSGTDSTYTYDKDSNVATFVNEGDGSSPVKQSTVTYTYDALNRRKDLSVSNPVGSTFVGTTSQTWKFDGLSRETECTDNNDTGTTDDVTCRYFYDSLSRKVEEGQQIGAAASFKDLSCNYDTQTSGGVWVPSQCVYPDGRKVDSTYDTLDRLIARTDNGQSSAIGTYAYLGQYRVATLTYQNETRLTHIGQTTTNAQEGFDDLRRITKHRWESFSSPDTTPGNDTLLVGFGHEFGTVGADGRATPAYDRMDNKLIEEKLHDSDSSEVYVYDSAYRVALPTSTYRSPAPANAYQRGTLNANRDNISTLTARPGQRQKDDWTLDGPGNWVSNPYTDQGLAAVTESRNHSDFNEINQRTISTDNTTHTLDKNGNILDSGQDVGTGGSRFFGGGLRMEWDALNRLRKVYYNANTPGSTGDDTLIAEYTYDCRNRRMRRVFTNNTAALNGTTDYYYEGWRVFEEHDVSDVMTQQYVYGNLLDEVWTLDDRRGSATVGDLNDGSGSDRRFYHCNTLTSIFALTDETGALSEAYQYNAYGAPTVWSGAGTDGTWFTNDDVLSTTTNGAPVSAVSNPYLYTAQRLEPLDLPETTLMYFKHRYYSPDAGRFLSRDPIFTGRDGHGPYEYVQSSAVNYADPMGLQPIPPEARGTRKQLEDRLRRIRRNEAKCPVFALIGIEMKRQRIRILALFGCKEAPAGAFGHWWVDIWAQESYGWWPAEKVGVCSTFLGVEGSLNAGGADDIPEGHRREGHPNDPHWKDEKVDEEFTPWKVSDPRKKLKFGKAKGKSCCFAFRNEIIDCIRGFATSFEGSWSWPAGPNCHTFQKEMMASCCMQKKKSHAPAIAKELRRRKSRHK